MRVGEVLTRLLSSTTVMVPAIHTPIAAWVILGGWDEPGHDGMVGVALKL
jgi:hypothetical protein